VITDIPGKIGQAHPRHLDETPYFENYRAGGRIAGKKVFPGLDSSQRNGNPP
jgi:hypothetical protein